MLVTCPPICAYVFTSLYLAAFRKGFRCQSTLLRLLEDWRKALDNHQSAVAAAVLMDLSLNNFLIIVYFEKKNQKTSKNHEKSPSMKCVKDTANIAS